MDNVVAAGSPVQIRISVPTGLNAEMAGSGQALGSLLSVR